MIWLYESKNRPQNTLSLGFKKEISLYNQRFEDDFAQESANSLKASLSRLIHNGFLERISKGLYLFAFSQHKNHFLIEKIAIALRPGHYNYLSLESALSLYGLISQIPVDRLTIMTPGRKGEYLTPYGTIEFTHTQRNIFDVLNRALTTDGPLKIATKKSALQDLKRVGRNLHLVNPEEDLENDE